METLFEEHQSDQIKSMAKDLEAREFFLLQQIIVKMMAKYPKHLIKFFFNEAIESCSDDIKKNI